MAYFKKIMVVHLFLFSTLVLFGQEHPGFYVEGRHIYDACGEEVVLRGVNKMTTWTDRAGGAFAEIEKTGANCVRIVMTKTDGPSDLNKWVTQCINNKMIPIPENHDATGKIEGVQAIVDWWCQPDMVDIIEKHRKHLIINIDNEAGRWGQQSQVRSTYAKAIVQMRDSGIHTPLIIDGSPYGQGAEVLLDNYEYWNNLDPDHNIIVSLHFYDGWTNMTKITNTLQLFIDRQIPLIIGEFSKFCNNGSCVPWEQILTECQKLEIGWIWWSWGPENQDQGMSLTSSPKPGLFKNLKDVGKSVAINHPYSIMNTSLRPLLFTQDSCGSATIYKIKSDTVGGGEIVPGFGRFHRNDTVAIKANSLMGYKFSHWEGDLSGSRNPTIIVMDTNKFVKANFVSVPTFRLAIQHFGEGVITPGGGVYNKGDTVFLNAEASPGYEFKYWEGDISGTNNKDTIIMNGDKTVTAVFIKQNSLIAYWPMDEKEGIFIADSSGNGYNATLNNHDKLTHVKGKINNALYFDGSREANFNVADAFQSGSITIAAFVKVNKETETWSWVASHGDNYGLVVNWFGKGSVLFYFFNGTNFALGSANDMDIRDGKWHHIAGTFNQTAHTIGVFRDGELIKETIVGGSIKYSRGNNFHIGSIKSQKFFYGVIDELRIYNQALNETEIAKLATSGPVTSIAESIGSQNTILKIYPNPFSKKTTLQFMLTKADYIKIDILDLAGNNVKVLLDDYQNKGRHIITWDGTNNLGSNLHNGIFICRLQHGCNVEVKKIILM